MLKITLIVVVLLIAGLLAYAATRPGSFQVQRAATLDASPTKVSIKLDFIKPFEAHNLTDFTLEPNPGTPGTPGTPGGTRVTWDMHGPSPYLSKLMGVFMNMDRMIGNDFEQGLANLKTVAEK